MYYHQGHRTYGIMRVRRLPISLVKTRSMLTFFTPEQRNEDGQEEKNQDVFGMLEPISCSILPYCLNHASI